MVGMVDDELAAELAVQGAQARGHEGREIALHYPLLQRHRARGGFDDVEESRPREVADFALMMDVVHQDVDVGEDLLLHLSGEFLSFILPLLSKLFPGLGWLLLLRLLRLLRPEPGG